MMRDDRDQPIMMPNDYRSKAAGAAPASQTEDRAELFGIASAKPSVAGFRGYDPLSTWSPSRRPPRHAARRVPQRIATADHLTEANDPSGWTLVGIEAADDLGVVRTGMTYNKEYGTSCGFFEKPRRLQFLEGPNEPAVADHLEMCPRFLDFQFQPLRLTFKRADGRVIHKFPDVAIEYDDHRVRFGEIKTNEAWFQAQGVKRPLTRIDQALASVRIEPLLQIKGAPFRTDASLEAHARAIEARLTSFDEEDDAVTVRRAISSKGGQARYGDLVLALGGRRAHAEDKLYAMLLRRIVAFDLGSLPVADTRVTAPAARTAFALRELLMAFQRKVA